jgi:hypothetical protein
MQYLEAPAVRRVSSSLGMVVASFRKSGIDTSHHARGPIAATVT